jgi:hypothetical protein
MALIQPARGRLGIVEAQVKASRHGLRLGQPRRRCR